MPQGRPPIDMAAVVMDAFQSLPSNVRNPVFIVPDRTRDAHTEQWLRTWREFFQLKKKPICLFASGIHKPMTSQEMLTIMGATGTDYRLEAHDADHSPCRPMKQPSGPAAMVNRLVDEGDCIILVSAMNWHYLAGFGGGRKLILPGVANRETATRFHRTSVNERLTGRALFAEAGELHKNPFHQAIASAMCDLPPVVGVCSVVHHGRLFDAQGGGLHIHHQILAKRFSEVFRHRLTRSTDGLLTSGGGAPFDDSLVQVHKALVNAARVVKPGGQIVIVAQCKDKHHNERFLLDMRLTKEKGASNLFPRGFVIRDQTYQSFFNLVTSYDVGLLSSLEPESVEATGVTPLASIKDCAGFFRETTQPIVVNPFGAQVHLSVTA